LPLKFIFYGYKCIEYNYNGGYAPILLAELAALPQTFRSWNLGVLLLRKKERGQERKEAGREGKRGKGREERKEDGMEKR